MRTHSQRIVAVESERDSAQSSCRIFEKQLQAVKEAAAAEKAKTEAELKRLREESEKLKNQPAPPPASAELSDEIKQKLIDLENLQKKSPLQAQVHKLQVSQNRRPRACPF